MCDRQEEEKYFNLVTAKVKAEMDITRDVLCR